MSLFNLKAIIKNLEPDINIHQPIFHRTSRQHRESQ